MSAIAKKVLLAACVVSVRAQAFVVVKKEKSASPRYKLRNLSRTRNVKRITMCGSGHSKNGT